MHGRGFLLSTYEGISGMVSGLNLDSLRPDYWTDERVRFGWIRESSSVGIYLRRKELK